MPTRPWFPLNAGDYLRDTNHLSLEEHGAYFKLICHAWDHDGCIPNDMRRIAQILGIHTNKAKTLWGFVGPFWYETHGGFRQKRIDAELTKSLEISEKRRKAAESRHHANAPANAPANAYTIHNQHSLGVPKERESARKRAPPAPKKSTKGTRWTESPEMLPGPWLSFALDQNVAEEDVWSEYEKFCDYWISQPGQKGVKLDWLATWRNWIRRSTENGKARTNGSGNSSERHISAAERVERAIAQRDADAEANGFIVDADGWTVRQ